MRPQPYIHTLGRSPIGLGLFAAVLLGGLLWAGPAWAGIIKISASVVAQARDSAAVVKVRVSNHGNDTAHQLRVIVEIAGQRHEKPGPAELAPGASTEVRFELGGLGLGQGNHPVLARIVFHNSGGHGFNNLVVGVLTKGKAAHGGLFLSARDQSIVGLGTVEFTMDSPSDQSMPIRLRVFAPREFKASLEHNQLTATSGLQTLKVAVRNLSAFAGASYPLYLIAEYDLHGVHHTIATAAQVVIGMPGDPLVAWRAHIIAASAGLLLLIVLIEVVRRWRRR